MGLQVPSTQPHRGQAEREGLKIGPAPDVPKERYINKRTGKVSMVPKGVHPAFHYPPSARRQHLQAHLAETEKRQAAINPTANAS